MLVQGVVEKVQEYPSKYQDKWGKAKPSMWAFFVDNIRYSAGNVKPPAVGSNVSFEAAQDDKGYWNADGSTIKVSQAVTNTQAPPVGQIPNKTLAFNDVRQDSIIYQSSRKDALEFVGMLLNAGLIDFGKAKSASKTDIVEIYVDNYTTRFFNDCKRLAPPEHDSPVDAEPIAAAQALAKPTRAKKAEPVAEEFEDDLPF